MNNREKYTDREWEELASLLSENEVSQSHLLGRFIAEGGNDTIQKWQKMGERGNEMEINVDNAWNKLSSRLGEEDSEFTGEEKKTRLFHRRFISIAAAILIIAGIGSVLFYISNSRTIPTEVVATDNSQMNFKVTLPDGSNIFLNRNTRVSYKSDFSKTGRALKLDGEAFFEITPDPSNPFIVDAGKAKIKVIGTSFNVITNNYDSAVEVFVNTGKVMLSDLTGSKDIVLDPGYVGTIKASSVEKKLNNNPNYISWKTGKLVYEGEGLGVVFEDLKRIYNINITASDPEILNQPITAVFDNESLETKIRIICATFNLNYQKIGNTYTIEKK